MRHLRIVIAATVIAMTLPFVVGAAVASAAVPYTFTFIEQANDFSGTGPANSSFTIRVLNGTTLVDSATATTNGAGNFQTFFASGGQMVPGFKLRVIKDAAIARTFIIPSVTALVDRVTDQIRGVAPANSLLRIQGFDCNMSELCVLRVTRNPTTSATGGYSVDVTTAFDVRGNDEVLTRYTSPQGDHVTARTITSEFGIDPAVGQVFGCVPAGLDVTLRLFATPGGALLEKHTVVQGPSNTCFDQDFSNAFSGGRSITASFASDATINIPNTSVTHTGTVVTVHCLPSRPILVEWFSDVTHHVNGTATASGTFVRDLTLEDPTVVAIGLELHVQCETAKGDRLEFRRTLS